MFTSAFERGNHSYHVQRKEGISALPSHLNNAVNEAMLFSFLGRKLKTYH
jgi:hypothetical protein